MIKYTLILVFSFFSIGLFSQESDIELFFSSADVFFQRYVYDGAVNYKRLKSNTAELDKLTKQISNVRFDEDNSKYKKAFYINAYNILVINKIIEYYPIKTVEEIDKFFKKYRFNIAGDDLNLVQIENEKLLDAFNHDPRLHFALVCGAIDCPKIADYSYTWDMLDIQLEDQTYLALNDDEFIKNSKGKYLLSQIFKWYSSDFGSNTEELVTFINRYREDKIDYKDIGYYKYNWALNEYLKKNIGNSDVESQSGSNNSFRYITAAALPKGTIEIKQFNSVYSQNDNNTRSTFFTASAVALYAVSNSFNVGFVTRYRKVHNDLPSTSAFDVFSGNIEGASRSRFTAVGPAIRWAPKQEWESFSIQSSLTFPIGSELEGSASLPYIDTNGPNFSTQFWNDKSIGNKFSLFTDVGIYLEDFGFGDDGYANSLSFPSTAILSYFPSKKITIYTLAGFSPYVGSPFEYYGQAGIGFKYQISPNLEIELLSTLFSNRYLSSKDGSANTYNIGFRYSNR
ncbi:MAG: DUF547 domain-containing protein [Saprospiraceae bacterium]